MQLFYAPGLMGDHHQLDTQESRHLIKVLRYRLGDQVSLTDGQGNIYSAIIDDANPNRCRLKIEGVESNYQPLPYHLAIAIAPTKNIDRIEWFLEKATEIGVSEIFFFTSDNSERHTLKLDRLQKVLIAAMKQSLSAFLPKLHHGLQFRELADELRNYRNYLAHCGSGEKSTLWQAIDSTEKTCIWIGPEGDFSPEEIRWSQEAGFVPISLGNRRLRTETAAVFAVSSIALLQQKKQHE